VPIDQLWKVVKFFLKHSELGEAVCLAHSLLALFPLDSAGLPAGREELITLIPQLQASLSVL